MHKSSAGLTPCRLLLMLRPIGLALRVMLRPIGLALRGRLSPSVRGSRERSERGGRYDDFLCKAPSSRQGVIVVNAPREDKREPRVC